MTGESLVNGSCCRVRRDHPRDTFKASELRLSHVVLLLLHGAPITMEEKDVLQRWCGAGRNSESRDLGMGESNLPTMKSSF